MPRAPLLARSGGLPEETQARLDWTTLTKLWWRSGGFYKHLAVTRKDHSVQWFELKGTVTMAGGSAAGL